MIDFLLILIGILFLYGGAEGLVKGSRDLALRWGISSLVVGLTVVAMATSSPELFVSVQAALLGEGDLAMGNIVGSNIANIGLILGLAALIRPLDVHLQIFRLDLPILFVVSLIVSCAGMYGHFPRWLGMGLFVGAIIYTSVLIVFAKKEDKEKEVIYVPSAEIWVSWLLVLGGLLLLIGGSEALVRGATALATNLGISQAVIGLTLVAIGTSLPELATSVVAARRGEGDIVLGNVIGSNIYNILVVLACASIFRPLDLFAFSGFSFVVMLLFTVILFPLIRTEWTIQRWEGGLLIFFYAIYIAILAN